MNILIYLLIGCVLAGIIFAIYSENDAKNQIMNQGKEIAQLKTEIYDLKYDLNNANAKAGI